MLLAAVQDCVRDELLAVERLFARELHSDLPCVATLARHVARFRGKMLRPKLVLLSAKAAGTLTPAHIVLATVVEMVHVSTLVHDDVLDEAELRRKGATINHLRGNEAAVMLGDYLISHSYHLCSSLDSQFASRLVARTTNEVCEGELLQIHNRNNYDLDESTYLRIIEMKTASLCGASCLLGARHAGAPEPVVRNLETYGRSLGIAFQVQDDILDLVGDTAVVGKSLGSDIEKGKLTLPLIHFLRTAPREHIALMRSLLQSRDPDKIERIRNLLLPSGSIEYARSRARHYVQQAHDCLADLCPSDAARLLHAIADFVLAREQ